MKERIDGALDILEALHVHGGGLSEILGPLKLGQYAWFGYYLNDPTTTLWSTSEAGRLWYNTTLKRFRWWNGSEIVDIRRIFISTSDPSGGDGVNGDIWIKYTP
jgi:hypothetical protein